MNWLRVQETQTHDWNSIDKNEIRENIINNATAENCQLQSADATFAANVVNVVYSGFWYSVFTIRFHLFWRRTSRQTK